MDATFSLTLIEAILILLAIAISKAIRLISPLPDSCKDAVDSIPTVSSPSNIIVAPSATKYDVFLSFRGEDTRDAFSSYLYEALREANIHTFMDHKLHKGDHISSILLKTIEESEISLIIFSKDYASSTWCMDELFHIMKCKDKYGRLVIPIFFQVDPSNIRKQNGSFGDGFAKLKQRFKHNQERVQKWENALIKAASLFGWDSKNIRPEAKLVKKIVKDILSKLNRKSSFHVEGLVGIDHQIQEVEELLSEARIVGIWGMGGIGKTTLASVVFERLRAEFEASCFVEDVRKLLEKNGGLNALQEKCLKELLKDEEINTYNLRSDFVRRRLHRKKILLVLDDVDNFMAAENLIKACGWFGEGSRIIITSRDMQVLKNTSAFLTYRVPTMYHHDALHLFSLKAFKQNQPFKNYLELSKQAVYYCHGNPLALKVLGCFLHGRGKEVWDSALTKLNHTLHKDIFKVLKLSFDGLDDDMQKNVFLDLAFFMNVGHGISLDCTRGLYGSHARIEISVLKERSLISVDRYGNIEMHALLVEMGLEISQQQLISNPEKPIRLWRPQDVFHFMKNDKGIEAIRCMSLDASQIEIMTLRASHFQRMHYLMFLNVYKSDQRKPSKLNICGELDYLSKELRFLHWEGYLLPYVPLQFCAENLIKLNLSNSNIQQLWDGNQQFPNLKEIWLENSKNLMALPDLSQAPKIKYMSLNGCVNLDQIHSSTVLEKQVDLFIKDCGPMRINVGGSMKGRSSSGFLIVHNYLDVVDLTFNKVTMKVMVCGKMMCGAGFKHVRMPLKEKAEFMRMATLLPFMRRVVWSESPIEFGHDFNQHHTYHVYHYYSQNDCFGIEVRVRGHRGESRVEDDEEEDEDDREMISENEREMSSRSDQVVEMTLLLMEDEQEEDDDEDDSESATTLIITTLIPNTIPRWSLLVRLTLKESDIIIGNNNTGCSIIPQASIILKSLNEDCRRRIQPLLAVQLSSPTLSPLPRHSFHVFYNHLESMPQYRRFLLFNSRYGSYNYFDHPLLTVSFREYC